MTAKRTIVRGADKNCRSKDPSTCRYHGTAFVALTKPSEFIAQVFEQVNKDLAPSMVIPASDTPDEKVWDRRFFEEDYLSDDQRYALHRYSDEHGSTRIRAVLMNPDTRYDFNGESMELIHERIKGLDSLLEDHSVDVSDITLWRGVKDFKYELSDIQEGSVFTNLSYTPTTTDPEVAVSFSSKQSPILLKVKAKQGYPVGGQFASEREVLLRRGMEFKVVSIKENVHVERGNPRFGDDGYVRGVTVVEIEEL
jgi:hypothetical protein